MIVRGHLATLEIFSIAKLNSFKRGYGPFASTTYGTKSAGSLIKLVLNAYLPCRRTTHCVISNSIKIYW